MNVSFKSLKNETRIIGIDLCTSGGITGAILRGGLYLDGVVVLPGKDDSTQIAERIKVTKYFPELKVVMIHDVRGKINENKLCESLRLPILVTSSRYRHGSGRDKLVQGNNQWRTSGVDQQSLRRILSLTQVKGNLPEPLRIAHLLAKLNIFGSFSQDKG